MTTLKVANVDFAFGDRRAVDGVSFEVAAGEVFGLLGPNGAGKSTIVHLIAGLLEPDAGSISVGGRQQFVDGDVRGQIGFVPQEMALTEPLSGFENLRFFGKLYGLRGADLDKRLRNRLDLVGLADRSSDPVYTYSGGMKRRLSIAAGVLHDPELLLMDEPTAGVDPQSRAHIFELVRSLAARGTSVLYTTHYMEEAERLCDRIAILDQGRILVSGDLQELLASASSLPVLEVSCLSPGAEQVEFLASEVGASHSRVEGWGVSFVLGNESPALVELFDAVGRSGIAASRVELQKPNLESIFLELTGRGLRD